jgi:hypothetical protein
MNLMEAQRAVLLILSEKRWNPESCAYYVMPAISCWASREKQSYLVGEAETHQEQGRLGDGTRCTINKESFTVGTVTRRKSALLVKRMGSKRRRPDLADIDWPLLNAALNSLLAQVQPDLLLLLTILVRYLKSFFWAVSHIHRRHSHAVVSHRLSKHPAAPSAFSSSSRRVLHGVKRP